MPPRRGKDRLSSNALKARQPGENIFWYMAGGTGRHRFHAWRHRGANITFSPDIESGHAGIVGADATGGVLEQG